MELATLGERARFNGVSRATAIQSRPSMQPGVGRRRDFQHLSAGSYNSTSLVAFVLFVGRRALLLLCGFGRERLDNHVRRHRCGLAMIG